MKRNSLLRVLLLSLFLLTSCATGSVQKPQARGAVPPGARILLIPPLVHLSELTAGGTLEPRADWTATAEKLVVAALDAQLRAKRLVLISYREPDAGTPSRETHLQLKKVHGTVGRAILLHAYNPQLQLLNKRGSFDWTLGEEVRIFKEDYGDADYALFSEFLDAYASGGRIALNVAAAVLGGPIRYGRQVCVASLVDLKTGDIVWFNHFVDPSGDLRTPEPAHRAVQQLLSELPL